jgi:NAD(P)-dependent dehydrogenase (short-subunit alcohol dehydrogenase family)
MEKSRISEREIIVDRLKGKRALITGGTSGIGLETARQFLKEGARIAITGVNPASLEAARKELGSDVLIIPSDARDVAAQQRVAESLYRTLRKTRRDRLCNCVPRLRRICIYGRQ